MGVSEPTEAGHAQRPHRPDTLRGAQHRQAVVACGSMEGLVSRVGLG